jgi:ERCC4-type nuclease
MMELYGNFLSRDRTRAMAALKRFSEAYRHPYLVLEGSPWSFTSEARRNNRTCKKSRRPYIPVDKVMDALAMAVSKFKLGLIWTGTSPQLTTSRVAVGDFLLRLMLRHWHDDNFKCLA